MEEDFQLPASLEAELQELVAAGLIEEVEGGFRLSPHVFFGFMDLPGAGQNN
jgi:hypothetical protein